MKIFKKNPQLPCLDRHDSLLRDLAMNTMAEHATDPGHSHELCNACGEAWPCSSYRLGQAGEIQSRHYVSALHAS